MSESTTALRKITGFIQRGRTAGKRIFVIRGGQGAGKTIAILSLIINNASNNSDREWIIISEELTKMKDSVIKDFLKTIKAFNIFKEQRWNKSEYVYTFRNGSQIKFRSTDKDDAGKGVRTYGIYVNEANKVSFEAYNQYASRAEIVLADYNPDAPFFIDDEVIPRKDCAVIQLTFRDNEKLNAVEREEIIGYLERGYININLPEGKEKGQRYHTENIKNKYWANKWQVYGLGNVGALLGVVFENWEIIDEIPAAARLRAGGGDFGYSNDPTAIVARYEWNGCPVFDEIAYSTGYLNGKIAEIIKASPLANVNTYFDNSRSDNIDDLKKTYHIKAVGADKGLINFSIELLQKYPTMYITQRSVNIIANLRNYVWATDRNGKPTNTPIDKHNHSIDAMRYEEMGKGKYNGQYTVR